MALRSLRPRGVGNPVVLHAAALSGHAHVLGRGKRWPRPPSLRGLVMPHPFADQQHLVLTPTSNRMPAGSCNSAVEADLHPEAGMLIEADARDIRQSCPKFPLAR